MNQGVKEIVLLVGTNDLSGQKITKAKEDFENLLNMIRNNFKGVKVKRFIDE